VTGGDAASGCCKSLPPSEFCNGIATKKGCGLGECGRMPRLPRGEPWGDDGGDSNPSTQHGALVTAREVRAVVVVHARGPAPMARAAWSAAMLARRECPGRRDLLPGPAGPTCSTCQGPAGPRGGPEAVAGPVGIKRRVFRSRVYRSTAWTSSSPPLRTDYSPPR
jgi:hypothetical protein